MKTQTNDLASIFSRIERAASAVEEVAKAMLAAIKAADARTLEKFNDMVADAYGRNGWSQRQGRPVEGAKERPAPDAVKLYVSTVRAGYRMGLKVQTFDTMHALRQAIREKRAKASQTAERGNQLRGVQVSSSTSLTGALIHDVAVLYQHLPSEQQALFEDQLRRLVARYTKQAPAELRPAA